jgi:hypothetical protein
MGHYNQDRRSDLFTQNFLWVGYHAWQGYLNCDRGVVVVSSDRPLGDGSDCHCGDSIDCTLNFRYIPQLQLPFYLQEWLVPEMAIESILPIVASYQPDTQLIFALESGVNVDIGWCQRLKVSPPDCYQQISRRWSEFSLGVRS